MGFQGKEHYTEEGVLGTYTDGSVSGLRGGNIWIKTWRRSEQGGSPRKSSPGRGNQRGKQLRERRGSRVYEDLKPGSLAGMWWRRGRGSQDLSMQGCGFRKSVLYSKCKGSDKTCFLLHQQTGVAAGVERREGPLVCLRRINPACWDRLLCHHWPLWEQLQWGYRQRETAVEPMEVGKQMHVGSVPTLVGCLAVKVKDFQGRTDGEKGLSGLGRQVCEWAGQWAGREWNFPRKDQETGSLPGEGGENESRTRWRRGQSWTQMETEGRIPGGVWGREASRGLMASWPWLWPCPSQPPPQ